MAKSKLEIKDTKDWVVDVLGEDKKVIDPSEAFKKLGLKCIVEIEWHKGEGGGGA